MTNHVNKSKGGLLDNTTYQVECRALTLLYHIEQGPDRPIVSPDDLVPDLRMYSDTLNRDPSKGCVEGPGVRDVGWGLEFQNVPCQEVDLWDLRV